MNKMQSAFVRITNKETPQNEHQYSGVNEIIIWFVWEEKTSRKQDASKDVCWERNDLTENSKGKTAPSEEQRTEATDSWGQIKAQKSF